MKTVCVISQSVYDSDPRVRRKAEALLSAGYEVDVLALRGPEGQSNYCLGGVNVRTCPLGKLRGSLPRYMFEYAAFFAWACTLLTLHMRRRRYAVVDVNTLPDFLIFAGIFARWMGAKLVLDMHEITPEFYMSKYGSSRDSAFIRAIQFAEQISFRFADQVITVNDPILHLLCSRGLDAHKATVITNAADESRFAAESSPGPQAETAAATFVMMYHGTLTRIYGLDLAIEAFARVHDQMAGAEFWILGSGTETEALAGLIQERGLESKVRLIGRVPLAEIPLWLSRCDIGILPIRRDVFLDFAFPNKLPEFIIMGKTAIVSRLRAIEYYFSGDALAYFEPNSPTDMSRQMMRMYQDPDLGARLAQRARQEYAPIRWEVMKERYCELIDRLSGDRPNKVLTDKAIREAESTRVMP